jgi:hypothetical protein
VGFENDRKILTLYHSFSLLSLRGSKDPEFIAGIPSSYAAFSQTVVRRTGRWWITSWRNSFQLSGNRLVSGFCCAIIGGLHVHLGSYAIVLPASTHLFINGTKKYKKDLDRAYKHSLVSRDWRTPLPIASSAPVLKSLLNYCSFRAYSTGMRDNKPVGLL